ncbi:MAG: tetratricopeptide repeat protein [Planctomycetes bacterium]|nr:tetratricopeptide repeat protein [Planctomycetota bacterium]
MRSVLLSALLLGLCGADVGTYASVSRLIENRSIHAVPAGQHVVEYERSSLLGSLFTFLFGTFIGWWILFISAFLVSTPFINRYRAWVALRRYMAAQGQKFANPQNADARFQVAQIYLQARRYRKALGYAREAVTIAEANPVYAGAPYPYLRALGQALYGLRRYAEAREAYERALKARSDLGYFDALLGLAKTHYRSGDVKRAFEYAKHAAAEQESQLEPYFRWAQAAAWIGRSNEVDEARRRFWTIALRLPRFARQRRLWWRSAFLMFPLSRRIG